ncbi:hypothetical protein ATE84_4028 [Aquimarina sp. MAR_2010_214]|uniref:CocE/NonD family hydrolase n=1 Tax=Aquimarina sp. MAR_2010_214 TaxID=1250026 RepID=UPI000CAFDB20|nr:CocE/NonD family hydrolase [Aquimarina sp. MAR_2010_214]PKV51928.1 hypothetical protein ATE84_4028 [Aquimarina sp. MAR_2010_214]
MKSNFFALIFMLLFFISCNDDDDFISTPTPDPISLSTKFSQYVTVSDGTRLAVTVYLPKDLTSDDEVPTIFINTRYGRESEARMQSFFTESGYALVVVDARGSSASFGVRPGEYSPQEVSDIKDILDWLVDQEWSDGNIGSYGVSYSGTSAELLAATQHPAVKAVIPGWSDFDIYDSPARPYGAISSGFISLWSDLVDKIDNGLQATPVDNDADKSLMKEAIAMHSQNPNVFDFVFNNSFKDSKNKGTYSHLESSPLYWKEKIEASNVPMLVFASWLDAGSADGAIKRFQYFSNSQKVILMADDHGAESHASPYIVSDKLISPSMSFEKIMQLHLDFFDTYLKGIDKGVHAWPNVLYYNFGEETYLSSDVWPPQGVNQERFYFKNNFELHQTIPTDLTGKDQYAVDFTTSTGEANRWLGQINDGIMGLHDRGDMDSKMLTYTTKPLSQDVQISGTPVISLQMSSTHEEGLVLVYLEDVDENGQSRYITEGGLNLIHEKENTNPYFNQSIPFHSFLEADASTMPINQIVEVNFQLLPTSVKIKAGHRIRIAIAGADNNTFDRIPKNGDPEWTFYRNKGSNSFIDLPIVH